MFSAARGLGKLITERLRCILIKPLSLFKIRKIISLMVLKTLADLPVNNTPQNKNELYQITAIISIKKHNILKISC